MVVRQRQRVAKINGQRYTLKAGTLLLIEREISTRLETPVGAPKDV